MTDQKYEKLPRKLKTEEVQEDQKNKTDWTEIDPADMKERDFLWQKEGQERSKESMIVVENYNFNVLIGLNEILQGTVLWIDKINDSLRDIRNFSDKSYQYNVRYLNERIERMELVLNYYKQIKEQASIELQRLEKSGHMMVEVKENLAEILLLLDQGFEDIRIKLEQIKKAANKKEVKEFEAEEFAKIVLCKQFVQFSENKTKAYLLGLRAEREREKGQTAFRELAEKLLAEK